MNTFLRIIYLKVFTLKKKINFHKFEMILQYAVALKKLKNPCVNILSCDPCKLMTCAILYKKIKL